MDDDKLKTVLAYAESGIPVFPLKDRGKLPLTVRGFKDATTDQSVIKIWAARWPNCNWGAPTGAVTRWAVVDIDPRHGGDVTWESLVKEHGEPPETLESLTGGGGRHLIFAYPDGFRNSAGVVGPGIDTRGDGGYIVVPESIHESGRPYEWEGGEGPETRQPAELPPWLDPRNAKPLKKPEGAGNVAFEAGAGKATGAPVAPGGRNQAAASLAGQWIQEGDSVHTVLKKLDAWNGSNPVPLPDKEIRSVAASVALTHTRNNPGAVVDIVDPPPELIPAELKSTPVYHSVAPKFPAELLDPPGLVGDVCKWINQTAYMPQPVLALGNSLAFIGAVVGRKVQAFNGLRSNLYVLGVGESGCGKDHSRQVIKEICDAAGTMDLLGGEDISSDSAILGAVNEHPSILFQWDEVGHLIANSTSRNAQVHQRAIAPLLTKLFSSARGKMLGKEYAGRKDGRKDIDQPNACVYGTTVPARLYEGLTPGEISDGFLGRMMVFQSDNPEPLEQDVAPDPVPKNIIQHVQAWHAHKVSPAEGGNIQAATRLVPYRVTFEADAIAEIKRFRDLCKGHKKDSREGPGDGLDALWSRAVEHACKIALIVGAGDVDSFPKPIVSGYVAEWSTRLVGHLVSSLVTAVGDSVAGSDFERELLYVFRAIRNSGPGGLSRTELLHKTRRLSPRQRDEILNQLVAMGKVIKGERKGAAGFPAVVYSTVLLMAK